MYACVSIYESVRPHDFQQFKAGWQRARQAARLGYHMVHTYFFTIDFDYFPFADFQVAFVSLCLA